MREVAIDGVNRDRRKQAVSRVFAWWNRRERQSTEEKRV
jgi:hypothetical protein